MPKVIRGNPKALETLQLRLVELSGLEEKVGWFETSRYEDGTPVAYVAAIQELGAQSRKIPPRPFMRPTYISRSKTWAETAAKGVKAMLQGLTTGFHVMEAIGLQASGDVLETIAKIFSPPLSPVTIELRAMKRRNPYLKVTGKTVGEAARKVDTPGYVTPNVSTKPLNDTGYMISTLTHVTEQL